MKKATIIRSICLLIVLINFVLRSTGHDVLNIDESQIAETVEMIISIAVIVLSWWKNNSFTENAQKADEYLEELRKFDEEDNEG